MQCTSLLVTYILMSKDLNLKILSQNYLHKSQQDANYPRIEGYPC